MARIATYIMTERLVADPEAVAVLARRVAALTKLPVEHIERFLGN
jgi:hypothetical protein